MSATEEVKTSEIDYEHPTALYSFIEKKNLQEAINRCKSNPEECATWIVKKNENEITWKLLPIHAAIIMRADETLVTALLESFPGGAKELDDQGMLPLHLAFRHSASEAVINQLIELYPEAMATKDLQGKVPLSLITPNNKKGNQLRSYAANLLRTNELGDLNLDRISELELKLVEANGKISELSSKDSEISPEKLYDQDDKDEIIEELETRLKFSKESYDQVLAMFESKKALFANEKSFLSNQIDNLTEAHESSMHLHRKTIYEHNKAISAWKKKSREARLETLGAKKKTEDLTQRLELLTKTTDAERISAEAKIDEYSEKLNHQQKELCLVRNQATELEKLSNEQKLKIDEMTIILENITNEREMFQHENDSLKKRLGLQVTELETARNMIETLNHDEEDLENELNETKNLYEAKIRELEQQLKDLEIKNREEVKEKTGKLNVKVQTTRIENHSLEIKVDEVSQLLENATSERTLLANEIVVLKKCKGLQTAELESAREMIKTLNEEEEKLYVELQETKDRYEKKIKTQTEEIKELRANVRNGSNALPLGVAYQQNQEDELRSLLLEKSKEIASKVVSCKKLDSKVTKLKSRLSQVANEYDGTIHQLETNVLSLNDAIEKMREYELEINDQITARTREIADSVNCLDVQMGDESKLKVSLDAQSSPISTILKDGKKVQRLRYDLTKRSADFVTLLGSSSFTRESQDVEMHFHELNYDKENVFEQINIIYPDLDDDSKIAKLDEKMSFLTV